MMKVGTLILSSLGALVISFGAGALIKPLFSESSSSAYTGSGAGAPGSVSPTSGSSKATNPSAGVGSSAPSGQNLIADGGGIPQGQAQTQTQTQTQSVGQPLISSPSNVSMPASSMNFEIRQLAITNKSAAESKFYSFSVSPRLDDAVYRLCDDRGSLVKESSNGMFSNIPPTESGAYQLVIVSISGVEMARKTITGFNKVNRLSSSQVEGILNGTSENNYKYFDVKNLQMKSVGSVPGDIAVLPTSLSAFNDIASNMGYHFSVSNVRYDSYNRVSSFDYTIN